MYTTPYILAHAPPVPSSISRNTGISRAPSTDCIYIQNMNNAHSADSADRQITYITNVWLIFAPFATASAHCNVPIYLLDILKLTT